MRRGVCGWVKGHAQPTSTPVELRASSPPVPTPTPPKKEKAVGAFLSEYYEQSERQRRESPRRKAKQNQRQNAHACEHTAELKSTRAVV